MAGGPESRAQGHTRCNEESGKNTRERVFLLAFRSHPASFHQALKCGKALAPCRQALQAAGLAWQLAGSGARLFVHPEQFGDAMQVLLARLGQKGLRPYHVVVTESLEGMLYMSLGEVSHDHELWVRRRWVLLRPALGREWEKEALPEDLMDAVLLRALSPRSWEDFWTRATQGQQQNQPPHTAIYRALADGQNSGAPSSSVDPAGTGALTPRDSTPPQV